MTCACTDSFNQKRRKQLAEHVLSIMMGKLFGGNDSPWSNIERGLALQNHDTSDKNRGCRNMKVPQSKVRCQKSIR
jgi:hypothetical protein